VNFVVLPEAETVKSGHHRYSKEDSDYIALTVERMLEAGWIRHNPDATVASLAYPVARQGAPADVPLERRKRFVVDYRGVNAHTKPTFVPMPNIESFAESLGDATVFGTIDLFNGFWQVPLNPDCQDYFSFRVVRRCGGIHTHPFATWCDELWR
jgi:hypothetical protein